MTGPVTLQLLQAAVKAVNMPEQDMELPTIWGAMVSSELQAAAMAARQAYASATKSLQECKSLEDATSMHKVTQHDASTLLTLAPPTVMPCEADMYLAAVVGTTRHVCCCL
jgi:hypothetical protein